MKLAHVRPLHAFLSLVTLCRSGLKCDGFRVAGFGVDYAGSVLHVCFIVRADLVVPSSNHIYTPGALLS